MPVAQPDYIDSRHQYAPMKKYPSPGPLENYQKKPGVQIGGPLGLARGYEVILLGTENASGDVLIGETL